MFFSASSLVSFAYLFDSEYPGFLCVGTDDFFCVHSVVYVVDKVLHVFAQMF